MSYWKQGTVNTKYYLDGSSKPLETNPKEEPTGHYTGRCGKCGSNDLWDDNHAYGCNHCKEIYIF